MASGLFQPPAELDPQERQLLQLQDEVWADESERFLDALEIVPGDRVLVYAAGPGLDLPRLARRVQPGGEVVAVEHNPLLAEEARALVKKQRLSSVNVVLGDLVVEPIPPGPYQVVFSSWRQGSTLAGPTTDRELAHQLKTLRPYLAPDGRLAFWEFQGGGWQVSPGTEAIASVATLLDEKHRGFSPAVRLPSAFLTHAILLRRAWPAQQAGLPGSRLHQLAELLLKKQLPSLLDPEGALAFWRDWEQTKVDPQTLVFSTRVFGIVGQAMESVLF